MAGRSLPPIPYGPRGEVIRVANLYIDASVNVDNMKRFLRRIFKDHPETYPAECIYPPDLDPLVYDRFDYLSMFESQDNVSEDTKLKIQAVRKLYLSKALVPKEGHTMFFRQGQSITGWFPAGVLDALYAKPRGPYFSERICAIPIVQFKWRRNLSSTPPNERNSTMYVYIYSYLSFFSDL